MAKALTMLLLLVAGTAVTSAHPIIGKGGIHAIQGLLNTVLVDSNSVADDNAAQQQQTTTTTTQQQIAEMQAQINQMQALLVNASMAFMNGTNGTDWNNTMWNNTMWNNTMWNGTDAMNGTAWNGTAWNATVNGSVSADLESRTTTTTTSTTTGSQTQTLSEFLTQTFLGAHNKGAAAAEQSYLDVKIPLPTMPHFNMPQVGVHHKAVAVQHEPEQDLSKCECKDDCKEDTRKKCKAKETEEEKCEEVPQEENVEVCEFKCYKGDHVVEIGGHHAHPLLGGRRLQAASTAGLPHTLAKAVVGALIHQDDGAQVQKQVQQEVKQQEICKEVCKPAKRALPPQKSCKKVKNTELVDCVVEVISKRCVKKCQCGEKTVTVALTPDFHKMGSHMLHQG